MDMDLAQETSKEYIWCVKLDKTSKLAQWEGREDGGLEQLVLKRACIGRGAKASERNLIEVTSFDHKQDKVEACICSLRSGGQEDVTLSDLTIFPPAVFKLVEGTGPVHLVGNHMMMDDGDDDSDQEFDEEDLSDEEVGSEEELSDMEDEIKPKTKVNGKVSYIEQEADEDDDEEDEDEEMEEEEEEETKTVTAPKKRKLEAQTKENKKPESTPKKKAADEKETKAKKKKESEPEAPKTPLQQKENKTPQSGKKTPMKAYESVEEVKAVIKKYPGGKPKKEDKFCNWVKSAFKVTNEDWIKQLWKAHKKELGL